jgi:aryl-alcohol dehydrogenase-like predicted oxidoreductase
LGFKLKRNLLELEMVLACGGITMQYTFLGRSGLKVSRICLGTMNFGQFTDENEAFRIMDTALDAGINFFDTANVYGNGYDQGQGRTEEIIGKWFAQGGGRREKVVLATKVSGAIDPNDGPNNEEGLSAYKIRRHIESSLQRLRTDYVELYQMHHIDRNVTWDELWMEFERLISQGKTIYIGSSNFAGWHLVVAQEAAKSKGLLGLISEQHKYNLMCRLPELELLPAAKELGIGVLPWSPMAEGLLAGLNLKVHTRNHELKKQMLSHEIKLNRFFNLCSDIGQRGDTVALSWLLNNSAVTAPVIGPRTLDQLHHSLKAVDLKMTNDILDELDSIFPGPGGPAPEAYAW